MDNCHSYNSFHLLASFWRGECLNLFSSGEVAVSECLEEMRKAGLELSAESVHPGHAARMRALEAALRDNRFNGHSRVALARVCDWIHLHEHRLWLAHGIVEPTIDAVRITLVAYPKGKREDLGCRIYKQVEMRDLLGKLGCVLALMQNQLGQIKATCRSRAP